MCQRIIMSPKNETCDAINAYVMQLIPGDADKFVSADSVEDSQQGRSQRSLFGGRRGGERMCWGGRPYNCKDKKYEFTTKLYYILTTLTQINFLIKIL